MKKDIYVIRNAVNDMCYVGQSVDYKTRFRKHKEEARRNNYKYKSYLYNAMNEIGIDKFYVELLESQVENYNEREIYWINKLNTVRPNGYNLARGGDWYPHLEGILSFRAKITSDDDLIKIYDELINGKKSLTEIGDDFNVKYGVIYDINMGYTYRMDGYEYPLRNFTLSKGQLDRLTYDLKYSNYSYQELAEIYGISKQQVKAINYGNSWKRDYIEYPIRKISFSGKRNNNAEKIQKDLLSTKLTFHQLCEKYKCGMNTIIRINRGESYKNEKLSYPLRKEKLNQKDINDIHDALLNTDESINSIANRFNTSTTTIKRINNGQTKKYIDSRYTYPLRRL